MAWDDIVVAHVTKFLAANYNAMVAYIKAHKAQHQSGGADAIKLDELAAPTDVTTLDVSIAAHGLCPKLPNDVTKVLSGTGTWIDITSGSGDVVGPTSAVDGNVAVFDTVTGKKIKDGLVALSTLAKTGDAPTAHAASHKSAGADSIKLDELAAPTDVTTLNATTTSHGLLVKATAPASGLVNVVGIANGETAYTNKPLFDSTNPAMDGSAAPGTQVIAARRDHVHPSDTTKIDKATNVTSINDTGIADGELAVFNLSGKDIRTSNVTIVTTIGSDDTTIPTSKAVKDYAPSVTFETDTDNIKMDGVVSVGALSTIPRADHVHASDTSKIDKATNVTAINDATIADGHVAVFNLSNKDIRTSSKTIVTTLGVDDTTIPTSKAVRDAGGSVVFETDTNNIKMDGSVSVGSTSNVPRSDHVHPTDTTRAAATHTHAESDVTNLTTDLAAKIPKATNVTAINDTGIADGEIAIFNLTNKDIRTSDKTIVTTLGSDDSTVPTSKAVKDVTDGAILKSLVDAKGDLLVGTADNTVARLPVGATNGHVLTVDSVESSGLKWAAASGLPSGTQGDIIYYNGSAWVVLSAGTDGQFLKTQGAAANPVWAAGAGGITADDAIVYAIIFGGD